MGLTAKRGHAPGRIEAALAALLLTSLPLDAQETRARVGPISDAPLRAFIARHERPGGGFGPPDQTFADCEWTDAALRIAGVTGGPPPAAAHRTFLFDLHESGPEAWRHGTLGTQRKRAAHRRAMAGLDIPQPPVDVSLPSLLPAFFDWHGTRTLEDISAAVAAAVTSGGRLEGKDAVRAWLDLARNTDGGWAHAPLSLPLLLDHFRRGQPVTAVPLPRPDVPSVGRATGHALDLHVALGLALRDPPRAAAFLRSLAVAGGGFRASLGLPEGSADLATTFDAVAGLDGLGDSVPPATVGLVARCRTADGGFAARPGEPADLFSTLHAVEILRLARAPLPPAPDDRPLPPPEIAPAADLPMRLALIEYGLPVERGSVSPGLTATLALRADASLLVLKNVLEPRDPARVADFARRAGKDLAVACAVEEPFRAIGLPGLGFVSHVAETIREEPEGGTIPGEADSPVAFLEAAAALRSGGALILSSAAVNPEILLPILDRRIGSAHGFDLMLAAWPFVPSADLLRDQPFLHSRAGRIPVFGNADAHHGALHWWPFLRRVRTYFFAADAGLAGFREAVARNRVVAVAFAPDGPAVYGAGAFRDRVRAHLAGLPGTRADDVFAPSSLPDPVIVPVDGSNAFELCAEPEAPFAVKIYAAPALGDDALPGEVEVRVDGAPIALRAVPPSPADPPHLSQSHLVGWISRSTAAPGPTTIEARAFGRTSTLSWTFRTPLPPRAPAGEGAPAVTRLAFDDRSDLSRVKKTLHPSDFRGSVRIVSRRADFLLDTPAEVPRCLRVVHRATSAPVGATVFVNGHEVGRLESDSGLRTTTLPLPPPDAARGIHVVLRATLPPVVLPLPAAEEGIEIDEIEVARGE